MGVRLLTTMASLLPWRTIITTRTSKIWIQKGKGIKMRRPIMCPFIARRDILESA